MITRRTTSARYRRHIATYGEDDCGVYCYQCSRRYFIDDTIGDKCPRCHGQVTCLVVIDPCEADLTDPDLAWLADDDTPAPPAIKSPYLTAEEAAAYLRVTLHALYGIVERGKLRPMPGHRRYRFTTTMLDNYLRGEEPNGKNRNSRTPRRTPH